MFDWLLTNTPLFYLTQSLWRDEAFSILIAEKPVSSFIGSLNFEPPLYYIFLHIWIRLFGTSEIAVRSLSLVGFSLAVCVVIFWAEKRFKHHWLSLMLPVLFFLNPMLLYYAFEARAYGWLMFFATLSMYAYVQKNHILTGIANIFAFYTHTYAIFIPFVQCIHYIFSHSHKRKFLKLKHLLSDKYLRSILLTGIFILPWFYPMYEEAKKMRPTWYYPVDFQLVNSVLGNMFIGYDGTPGGLWAFTFVLSLLLCCMFFIAFKNKSNTMYL
ncbi:MAG: glycosyltransferase family 39 protein [Patescibacteria group bacterium]|nr:glycosyltransferase family 39 protein [Patescibacteria group bacterium]